MADLKRVIVFIASPGDVAPARSRVRHAVERINRLLAKESGVLLEPIGWEDIPPGRANRSQDVINAYVDKADIFIGILHQRFGAPTGVAESGTEEEFLRIEKRWEQEDPKPSISMYFKKVPQDRISDPGPQLKKVLEFKERIKSKDFYSEFDEESVLEEDTENALADWVHQSRSNVLIGRTEQLPAQLRAEDTDVLVLLAKIGSTSFSNIGQTLNRTDDVVTNSLERLTGQNLIQKDAVTGYHKLAGSADAFVSIAKHLLTESHYREFLSSPYFSEVLNGRLPGILANRQHCTMNDQDLTAIQVLLKTSPSATAFILFGDTTLFDNLADQVRQQKMNTKLQEVAHEITAQNVLQQVTRFWINDALDAKTVREIDGKQIVGQVVRMGIAAAFEERLAFQAFVVAPMMRVRASGRIEAGQMVSGPPEFLIHQGTILFHLGQSDLALIALERALKEDLTSLQRAAALNNKGLALLGLDRSEEARICFEEALQFEPDLEHAKKNLAMLKESRADRKQI